MSTRSLNKVMLIGNLTRDPELRYTPQGTPVCSFGIATNRSWNPTGSEERREETEFHNIVAWSKLGELCAQLLVKGRKIYIEGRLQTRNWETQEGEKRTKVEIIAEDMIILDRKGSAGADEETTTNSEPAEKPAQKKTSTKKSKKDDDGSGNEEEIDPDSIPF